MICEFNSEELQLYDFSSNRNIETIKTEQLIKDFQYFGHENEILIISKNDLEINSQFEIKKKKGDKFKNFESFELDSVYQKIVLNEDGDNLFFIGENKLLVNNYYNDEEHRILKAELTNFFI